MKEGKHIIQKVFVEIHTNRLATATKIKDSFSVVFKEKLFGVIENRLNEIAQPGVVHRFEKIDLSFSVSSKGFEQEFVDALDRHVPNVLERSAASLHLKGNPIKPVVVALNENRGEQFLYFLEHGFLPWYGDIQLLHDAMKPPTWQELLEQEPFIGALKRLLQRDACLERFIYHVDIPQLVLFLQCFGPRFSPACRALIHQGDLFPREVRNKLFHFLVALFLEKDRNLLVHKAKGLYHELSGAREGGTMDRAIVEDVWTKTRDLLFQVRDIQATDITGDFPVDSPLTPPSFSHPVDPLPTKVDPEPIHQAFRVRNGGLILLHPFLHHFIEQMHFNNHHLAIQALHFLATSNHEFLEPNLTFEKFLCGVPLNAPVERQCLLTEAQKQACYNLLDDVIEHWPALKSSSRGWLQQMFLQREGKLMKMKENWRLVMEKKAQDILLQKLDWNISIVKTPLREDLLFVEWV